MKICFVLLAPLFLIFSCTDTKTSRILPASAGEYGHVSVVVEGAALSSVLKDNMRQAFEQIQPLYGQPEAYFNIDFLTPGLLKGGTKLQGTMIFAGVNSSQSELRELLPEKADSIFRSLKNRGSVSFVMKDVWAAPQRLLFILAEHPDSLAPLIKRNSKMYLDKLLELETQEAGARLTYRYEKPIYNELAADHQLKIKVPATYRIALNKKFGEQGFVWLRKETPQNDLGLLIHYEPYTDTSQFSLDYILNRRDSLCRQFIPGPDEGSYMGTDRQFEYPLHTTEFHGRYAKEYYALWTMVNDFMGGPFYSLTVHDKEKNRLVTLEGFIYAPKYEKRRYMRELQGLIQEVEF